MAENTGNCSYKTGIVVDARPGFARVRFPDLDDLLTDWLPMAVGKTLEGKACHTLSPGEHVACLLDAHFDDGCILGALYSDADAPPVNVKTKTHWSFADGGMAEYDTTGGTLSVIAKGQVVVTADGPVTVKAPSVTIDAPEVRCEGDLLVEGKLTYQGGMAGSGGDTTAVIQGDVHVTGTLIDEGGNTNHHSHS
uniref:Phage baseplate assembly protein V n=1 Tax=Candidatus Kentrum sp. LPFa TaxID=2126335 RepID=A0A450WK68_9GAMM|nr:MAG: phage baseplate assembly protein V [Candidatus Kentron sp. LPFa]